MLQNYEYEVFLELRVLSIDTKPRRNSTVNFQCVFSSRDNSIASLGMESELCLLTMITGQHK